MAGNDAVEHLAVHLRVSGRVQGVGFRYHVTRAARSFGLVGFVRNLDGGEVEVLAEGRADTLERFVEEVRRGPAGARVEDVSRSDDPATGSFDGFHVRL